MRGSFFTILGTSTLLVAACSVYDSSLLLDKPGGSGGNGGSPGNGGGTGESGGGSNSGGSGGAAVCSHVSFPLPPTEVTASTRDYDFTTVQVDVDLGDSAPVPGGTPPTRYRNIGFDLDEICTTEANRKTGQSCKLPTSAEGVIDGPDGQDNAMGVNIQFIRERIADFTSEQYSKRLREGVTNVVLRVSGYNGQADDNQVTLDTWVSADFDALTDDGRKPKWDGTDVWPIASDSTKDGKVDTPKFSDTNAYVVGGKLVGNLPAANLRLVVAFSARQDVNLDLNLSGAYLVCDIESTEIGDSFYTLTNCTLAGRWFADHLIHQLSHFPEPLADATTISHLCNTPSGSYATFKTAICGLVDVRDDPRATPTQPCNALSFGVVFNTVPAHLGQTFTVIPEGELCPPGEAPSNDSCDTAGTGGAGGAGSGGKGGAGGAAAGGAGGKGGTDGGSAEAGSDAASSDARAD